MLFWLVCPKCSFFFFLLVSLRESQSPSGTGCEFWRSSISSSGSYRNASLALDLLSVLNWQPPLPPSPFVSASPSVSHPWRISPPLNSSFHATFMFSECNSVNGSSCSCTLKVKGRPALTVWKHPQAVPPLSLGPRPTWPSKHC